MEDRAIIKDIETSNLQELNIWAKNLGLNPGNNAESLRRILARYYNLELSKTSEEPKKQVITIDRAELSTYYTMEEVDESVAEFEGRVQIIIDNTEDDIQHSIVADKVNFNRTLNSVTAVGNVEYIKTEGSESEVVTAESLTFNLDNWQGSMIKCVSKQDKTINEEELVFYYVTGEIKKSDTDVMGMNDVTIQTVEGSPYFNISALDLWMLDSSDFVLIVPSIKVGHVPVFIAPFYYHSDNSLYFNPVYGVRSREGTTFQNTIYFLGGKPLIDEESDFSFLSFNNEEVQINKELNGLTLVPSDDKNEYSSDYSKVMIDYYSNLGLFFGNNTELELEDVETEINFDGGIGFSRNIDDFNGDVFENGVSDWNSSYFYNTEVPFRYMIDLSIESPIGVLDFKNYSDPYFRSDFYNREENFKWIDYFTDQLDDGFNSESALNSTTYARDTTTESIITSYDISIDINKINPSLSFLSPYIDEVELDIKEISIDYSSKIAKGYEDSDDEDSLEIIYEDYDPAYKFFYPEKVTVPITLSISGELIDTKNKSITEENNIEEKYNYTFSNPIFNIENPLITNETNSDIDSSDEENVLDNIYISDIFTDDNTSNITTEDGDLWVTLDYDINAPFTFYGYWDYDNWNNSLDVDYDLEGEEILYNFDPSSSIDFSLGWLNSFFTIDNILDGNIYKKGYLEDHEQSNLEDVYSWNKTLLENDLEVNIEPFKLIPTIESHTILFNYNLNTLLYSKSFDDDLYEENGSIDPYYTVEPFKWSEDFVFDNEISGSYKYDIDYSTTTFEYITILPPFDEEKSFLFDQVFDFDLFTKLNNVSETSLGYNVVIDDDDKKIETYSASQSYSISIADISASINSGVDYSESFLNLDDYNDEWDFSGVEILFEYSPNDYLELSLSGDYSIEDKQWDDFTASFILGDLELELLTTYDIPQERDIDNQTWIDASGESETLLLDTLTINHNFDLSNFKFWKNRITLDISSDFTLIKEFIYVEESELEYSLDFSLDIFDFLSVDLSTSSNNTTLYEYFEDDYTQLGLLSGKNILIDLIKSFNIFSEEDRIESSFNLYTIDLEVIYKMPDWNLILNYNVEPILDNYEYEWYQTFSFFIEWKPLSIISTNVVNEDSNWTVSTSTAEE